MKTEQVKTRKIIADKYLDNQAISQRKLAKQLNLPKTTIQNVLSNFRKTLTIERTPGSSRKKRTIDKKLEQKTLAVFSRNCHFSERVVAEKVGTSASTVHRIKGRAGLRSFKVQNVQDRTEKKIAKSRARKLYSDY